VGVVVPSIGGCSASACIVGWCFGGCVVSYRRGMSW